MIHMKPYLPLLFTLAAVLASCKKNEPEKKQTIQAADTCALERVFRFHKHLPAGKATFDILSWGNASLGRYMAMYSLPAKDIYISAQGDLDGNITRCWLTDLDQDSLPELIVESESAGSGSYGNIFIFEPHHHQLAQYSLPPISGKQAASYGGHDHYRLEGNSLERKYVSYHPEDDNAKPSGDTIVIRYILKNDSMQTWHSSPQ